MFAGSAYFVTANASLTSYLYDLSEDSWLLFVMTMSKAVVVGVDFIAGVIVCNKTIKMKMKFINVGICVYMYKVRVYDGKMEKVSNASLLLTKKKHTFSQSCLLLYRQQLQQHSTDTTLC